MASWHFTVDQNEIYQSIPTNEVGWHAGDGRGLGNMQSIGVEICVNSDGDFTRAKENAVWLIRYLMEKHNIPISRVVPHKHWSGKDCPHEILPYWNSFIQQIKAGSVATVAASKPVENYYDLSIAKDYKLVGLRSSKHPAELAETLAKMMEAEANFIVITKRGADMVVLQKTLNPEEDK